jgi:altronate dehydratase
VEAFRKLRECGFEGVEPSLKDVTDAAEWIAASQASGLIIDGTVTVQEKGREIFETILRVASGQASRSEALGMGQEEFVPWYLGAVM